jgi:hypothetical protein
LEISSRILCHRGFWASENNLPFLQKNSLAAFKRAIEYGYGIETDIRDFMGDIIISHDVPLKDCSPEFLDFSKFLELDILKILAVNVKSDGLITLLQKYKDRLSEIEYFFFDLSIPELVQYQKSGFSFATRISEYETISPLNSNYIWVDSFKENFWNEIELLKFTTRSEFKLILVSPELHGFDPIKTWKEIGPLFLSNPNLFICTDLPLSFEKILYNTVEN